MGVREGRGEERERMGMHMLRLMGSPSSEPLAYGMPPDTSGWVSQPCCFLECPQSLISEVSFTAVQSFGFDRSSSALHRNHSAVAAVTLIEQKRSML